VWPLIIRVAEYYDVQPQVHCPPRRAEGTPARGTVIVSFLLLMMADSALPPQTPGGEVLIRAELDGEVSGVCQHSSFTLKWGGTRSAWDCFKELIRQNHDYRDNIYAKFEEDLNQLENTYSLMGFIRDKLGAHRDTNLDLMQTVNSWANITRLAVGTYLELFAQHIVDIFTYFDQQGELNLIPARLLRGIGIVHPSDNPYRLFDEPLPGEAARRQPLIEPVLLQENTDVRGGTQYQNSSVTVQQFDSAVEVDDGEHSTEMS